MDIILSTGNPSKAQEIKAIFVGTPFRVLSLHDAGIEDGAVEDGTTIKENALIKARFARAHAPGISCMADDTGLFVDALDGEPGAFPARWAGEGKTAEEIMRYTLERLKGVPIGQRRAVFRTVAAVITVDGKELPFVGESHGSILEEPVGPSDPRMPHSTIFVPEGWANPLSLMTLFEKNLINHRGRAFSLVKEFFLGQIGRGGRG